MTKICERQTVEVAEKDMGNFVQDHIPKIFEEKLLNEMKNYQALFERHKQNPLEEIGFVRMNEKGLDGYAEGWVMKQGDAYRTVFIRKNGSIVCDLEPEQVPALLKYLDQKAGKKEPGQEEVILRLIEDELIRANIHFPAFASPHEGWAVLYEEVSETNEAVSRANVALGYLWDLIRKHKGADKDLEAAMKIRAREMKDHTICAIEELIQVAAMCNKMSDVIWPGEEVEE